MSAKIINHEQNDNYSSVYAVTRSRLGNITKVVHEPFVYRPEDMFRLKDRIDEKLSSLRPDKSGFQYMVSFKDGTHFEHSSLKAVEEHIEKSDKETLKVILNWTVGHNVNGIENELNITISVSNPANPLATMKAMFSNENFEAEKIMFEDGATSISINGATHIFAEEVFSMVIQWKDGCPKPSAYIGIPKFYRKNIGIIKAFNSSIFPILYLYISFAFLTNIQENEATYAFVLLGVFFLIREFIKDINQVLETLARKCTKFSMFMITAGDSNQQTKIAAQSQKSTIALVISSIATILLNVVAGLIVFWIV